MFDDIRVRVDIPHRNLGEFGIYPDGRKGRPQRIKKWGIANQTIRIKSVKKRTCLVIEGSFNGYLNGQTVVGTTNLVLLVKTVVDKVLAQLGIKPTRSQQRMIDEGRIKLERLDFVGYLRVDHLGGPSDVLKALDIGLAGSQRNRMVYPKETVVYHSGSAYWSLMAYDKAQHLRKKYPELWASLDPRIKAVARKYLRVELRQFSKQLSYQGWKEVRDVDLDYMKELFNERLHNLMRDLRRPYPTLPKRIKSPSKALLLGLLAMCGVDFISSMPARSQSRVRKQLLDNFGVHARADDRVPPKYVRSLEKLRVKPSFPIRHGAPRKIRKAGLIALP